MNSYQRGLRNGFLVNPKLFILEKVNFGQPPKCWSNLVKFGQTWSNVLQTCIILYGSLQWCPLILKPLYLRTVPPHVSRLMAVETCHLPSLSSNPDLALALLVATPPLKPHGTEALYFFPEPEEEAWLLFFLSLAPTSRMLRVSSTSRSMIKVVLTIESISCRLCPTILLQMDNFCDAPIPGVR